MEISKTKSEKIREQKKKGFSLFSERTQNKSNIFSGLKSERSRESFSEEGLISSRIYIIVISLVQGLCDIASLAFFIYQKDNLKMEPETIQFLAGIVLIPWCLKPIFGFFFDNIIQKIKKTKYIIIVDSFILMFCYYILVFTEPSILFFYLIMIVINLAFLFNNIICEYLLVLTTKRENREKGTTSNHLPVFFGFRAGGSLIGVFFGGRIIKAYSVHTNFFIAGLFPIIIILVAIIYKERDHKHKSQIRTFKEELVVMKNLVFREKVLELILLIFLINMTPNFDMLVTFYMTDYLKFTTEDLANFAALGTVCYITALILYSFYFQNLKPRKFYIVTNFLLWFINLSFLLVVLGVLDRLGISNKIFCLFSVGFGSFVAELNFMPILAIWCAICPDDLEATSITLFTGLLNLSYNLSNYFGSFLIWCLDIHKNNFNKLWVPIVIQNSYLFIMICAIIFIEFPIPDKIEEDIDMINSNNIQSESIKGESLGSESDRVKID